MTDTSRHASGKDVAAVILAAGLSSRMGALKPLLPLGDGTVLARVIAVAKRAGADPVHVVTGHRAEEIAPHAVAHGATPVVNPAYRTGMLSSIKAGIASLPATVMGCVLMPADIPLVRPTTIARVISRARRGDALVVHPIFLGQRGHPPFIAKSLFAEFLGASEADGAHAVLARHETAAVDTPVCDQYCLSDMDTPAEHRVLAAALAAQYLPSEAECLALFEMAGTPEPVRRHGRTVATLATRIARELVQAGVPLDIELIRAAALLHDSAKGYPNHAQVGADLVAALGYPALSAVIAHHMALPPGPPVLNETTIVYLADKLVSEERRVTLDERFAPALERFAADKAARAGALRRLADAKTIARAVEDMGVCLSDPPACHGILAPSPGSLIREIDL